MADQGSGTGAGEPLTAPIGEQLRAKEHLEAEATAERVVDEQAQARTERHKAEERAAVAEHLAAAGAATPEGWREQREAARARGRAEARARDWGGRGLPLAGIALAIAGLASGRRLLVVIGLPLIAGALLLRNRTSVA
jgi:hypothetical protein